MAPDGLVLQAHGPGLSRLDFTPLEVVGASIWTLCCGRPDLLRLWGRLLRGGSHFGVIEYGGLPWLLDALPVRRGGGLVGTMVTTTLFEPVEEVAPSAPGKDIEEWICLAPVRRSGLNLCPDDILIRNGSIWSRTHLVNSEAAEEVTRSEATRLQRVSVDAPPAFGWPADPTGAAPRAPHLRVVG